jgi:hypothetical protein
VPAAVLASALHTGLCCFQCCLMHSGLQYRAVRQPEHVLLLTLTSCSSDGPERLLQVGLLQDCLCATAHRASPSLASSCTYPLRGTGASGCCCILSVTLVNSLEHPLTVDMTSPTSRDSSGCSSGSGKLLTAVSHVLTASAHRQMMGRPSSTGCTAVPQTLRMPSGSKMITPSAWCDPCD